KPIAVAVHVDAHLRDEIVEVLVAPTGRILPGQTIDLPRKVHGVDFSGLDVVEVVGIRRLVARPHEAAIRAGARLRAHLELKGGAGRKSLNTRGCRIGIQLNATTVLRSFFTQYLDARETDSRLQLASCNKIGRAHV